MSVVGINVTLHLKSNGNSQCMNLIITLAQECWYALAILHNILYCILQIIEGGEVSRLWNSVVFCWKTFTVLWLHGSFVWPYQLFHWKTFTVANQSVTTAKVFHLEWFVIYHMWKMKEELITGSCTVYHDIAHLYRIARSIGSRKHWWIWQVNLN